MSKRALLAIAMHLPIVGVLLSKWVIGRDPRFCFGRPMYWTSCLVQVAWLSGIIVILTCP